MIILADSSEAAYWQMGVGGKLVCKSTHIDNTTTQVEIIIKSFFTLIEKMHVIFRMRIYT